MVGSFATYIWKDNRIRVWEAKLSESSSNLHLHWSVALGSGSLLHLVVIVHIGQNIPRTKVLCINPECLGETQKGVGLSGR